MTRVGGGSAWRVVGWLFAGAIALNLVLVGIEGVASGPGGPVSSSFATAPEGVAGFAELLVRRGRTVAPLRSDPATSELPPDATLVVLDPGGALVEPDVVALRSFVEAGGRLVIGGSSPTWLARLLDERPRWRRGGPPSSDVLVPVAETSGVRTLSGSGAGVWIEAGSAVPVVGTPTVASVLVADQGAGRIVLVADTAFFQNAYLDVADNAAFALGAVGEPQRPVLFLESVHGYRDATGLWAVPFRWRWFLGGCVVAAILWMLSRGRRLGPPERRARDLPPGRLGFIASLAATLGRTRDLPSSVDPLRDAARRMIGERVRLPSSPSDRDIVRGAQRLGLDDEEAEALVQHVRSDRDAISMGRAFSRLMRLVG